MGGGAGLAAKVPQLIHRTDRAPHTHESSRLPAERRGSLHPPRQALDRDRHALLRALEGGYSILIDVVGIKAKFDDEKISVENVEYI